MTTLHSRRFILATAALCAAAPFASGVELFATRTGTDSSELVRFDSAAPGGLTVVGSSAVPGVVFTALDADRGGHLFGYGVDSATFGVPQGLFSISTTTGAATAIGGGGLDAGFAIQDLSFNPVTGQMLGLATNALANVTSAAQLYSVDTTTGAASKIGDISGIADVGVEQGLATRSDGTSFVLGTFSNQMYRLGGSSGTTATALPVGVGFNAFFNQGMVIDWRASDAWYYAAYNLGNSTPQLRTVNVNGGTALVGNLGNGTQTFGDVAVLPEPTSLTLLGLGGLGLLRRRRVR